MTEKLDEAERSRAFSRADALERVLYWQGVGAVVRQWNGKVVITLSVPNADALVRLLDR